MKQKNGIIKIGGIAFVIFGILTLIQNLFLLPISSPPALDSEIQTWLTKWQFHIAMADEVLFFATLALIPSIAALYKILVKTEKVKALIGCGILALILPVNIFLDIILGRLAYPVYNMELSTDINKLVLSIYYGGTHCAAILWSVAIILLCFVIRKSAVGRMAAYFGFLTAVLVLIGAFPWLIGSVMYFIIQLFFSAWFIILGIRILAAGKQAGEDLQ